jgi:Flp pilus assembly protein TadG
MRLRSHPPVRQGPRRRGAAAAELAILLPFVVFLFAIAADFCRVFYYSQAVQNCAESGALYACQTAKRNPNTTSSESDAAVQAALAEGATLNPPLTADYVSVSISGSTASVTVTYPFTTVTGFPGIPSSLTISRTVTMNVAPQVGQ